MMRRVQPRSRSTAPALMLALFALLIAGCSSLPGLRVLTGEDTSTNTERAVESITLVMGDKTNRTDPSFIAAGTRIEAADPYVDVIEVRPFVNIDNQTVFSVSLIYRPPQTDNTTQGRLAAAELMRRMFELAWQGTIRESEGNQILQVSLYTPAEIPTLDNGVSYVGILSATTVIDRANAAAYLQGTRSLETFYGLIVDGTLTYTSPQQLQLYDGTPNHPLFMIGSIQTTNRTP